MLQKILVTSFTTWLDLTSFSSFFVVAVDVVAVDNDVRVDFVTSSNKCGGINSFKADS